MNRPGAGSGVSKGTYVEDSPAGQAADWALAMHVHGLRSKLRGIMLKGNIKRAVITVLDGFGIGELPDAAGYGDAGSDTLDNTARA